MPIPHISGAAGSKMYPCEVCIKSFTRNGDLKRHKSIHSGEKNHKCDICSMRFAQHSGLKTHRNTHTGEKPHKCDYCGKAFGDPSSCARHEKEKHLGKPFQCHWCPSSIVRRSSFASHIRQKHADIAHLVTKEFLDELEGPRMLKPRNRRGRARRGAIIPDPRIISKNIEDRMYDRTQSRCAPTLGNEVKVPVFPPSAGLSAPNAEVIDTKVSWERARRNAVDVAALPFACHGPNFGSPYVSQVSMAPQRALQYTQLNAVYQRPPQMVEGHNWKYGLPGYGGPPEYEMVADGRFEVRSASSSPGPLTPADVKLSPVYVDPSKVNSYDYSFFGAEEYAAPPMYSFVAEQQGLPYGV